MQDDNEHNNPDRNVGATRHQRGIIQHGMRALNEPLVLSLLRRRRPRPISAIARMTGLSPQTASVINRYLEAEDLIHRERPSRGRFLRCSHIEIAVICTPLIAPDVGT